ncbi:MAG TPA: Smr/MutS family protein [Beijerinckiaceae bacterium]|jgi:DNA-nicking Smr family endonuclease
MKPRRSRPLSSEERRLWAQVARAVTPLPGRTLPELPPERPPAQTEAPPPSAVAPPRPRTGPALPPLAPLDRKTLLALRRGARRADAVIDLHGMRQAEAHGALVAFLHRSRERGHAVVLVVTGKGASAAGEGLFEERGVLRRAVPHWLRLPELRAVVLGFEEAASRHGGSGALYVRLRKRRSRG